MTLGRDGRLADVEREYRASLALDPRPAAARNNLGTLLYRQGRAAEALEHLRAGAVAAPGDAEIRANLRVVEAALRR